MKEDTPFELTSANLHILGLAIMLCDHIQGTILPSSTLMNGIGRLAFPVFAFLLVEGYTHTKNLKRYTLRLLIGAIVSEVPFNLFINGSPFYPQYQNVLWTFLMALGLIYCNEKARESNQIWLQVLAGIGSVFLSVVLGLGARADYQYAGLLMVLSFYFLRGRKWYNFFGQLLCMWIINAKLMHSSLCTIQIMEHPFRFGIQSIAVFALVPIWMYKGQKGHYSRTLQYVCYGFYPVHLLIISLLVAFGVVVM